MIVPNAGTKSMTDERHPTPSLDKHLVLLHPSSSPKAMDCLCQPAIYPHHALGGKQPMDAVHLPVCRSAELSHRGGEISRGQLSL